MEAAAGGVAEALLASWRFDPWLLLATLLTAAVYLRGFALLRRQMPERFPTWRAAVFLGGLVTLLLALVSPLDALAPLLLVAHMTQHALLMLVVPPLVLLGAPWIPLLRGLPLGVQKDVLGPFLAAPCLTRLARTLTHPLVAWSLFVATTWIWHVPVLYQRALLSPLLHSVEHACFLIAALLFWWPVVQPWPSRPVWPRWTMVPYLLLADLQSTIFSALFAFLERPIYPAYERVPRIFGLSALDDQATAGAIMWVPGSAALLVAAGAILLEVLSPRLTRPRAAARSSLAHSRRGAEPFDLLRAPLIGALLRGSAARRLAQAILLLVAVVVMVDGFFGPPVAALNLAGTLPWTYGRGLVVIGLLAAGNLFCMACPFMLPRELAKRLPIAQRRWPVRLRSKWLAVVLLAGWLWAYEALDLWSSPWWTAWLILAYFIAAFVVDAFFRGASFCKYVCPIGQFHFLQSTVSPLEIRVREPEVCGRCATQDCLRGNAAQRGCELELFLPVKQGNFDCTFCLDCVHACPHDNVGMLAVLPGSALLQSSARSPLGRLSQRVDLAVLALLFTFGAFVNAAGMVEPAAHWEAALAGYLEVPARIASTTLLLATGLVVLPLACVLGCTLLARPFAHGCTSREILCRFSLALLPLGCAMWLAHFLLHLVHGGSLGLVVARAASDLGLETAFADHAGHAMMAHATSMATASLPLELLLLDAGLLLALYLAWRVAGSHGLGARRAAVAAPWGFLAVCLYLAGVWIAFQPMQMRGMAG